MRICMHCGADIEVRSRGDESWDYCPDCEIIEPDTIELEEPDDDET